MTKRHEEERELQDYLDGRLSEEERERFEARLEREPELARRVATCREIGDSLREADEDLPPGFYTRARAAFEEASKGREAKRWFRPLSWETAGLAAVVLVAAALYLPGMLRSPSPRDAFTEPPSGEKAGVRWVELEKAVDAGEVAGDELAESPSPAGPEVAPVADDRDESRGVAGLAPPPAPSDMVRTQVPPAEAEGLGAVAKKEAPRTGAARDKGEDHEPEAAWAPSPPAEARVEESVPPAPATEAKREPEAAAEMSYTNADLAGRSRQSAEAVNEEDQDRPAAVPLTPGFAEAGTLRVVDEPEEWRALLLLSAEPLLEELGGFDPGSRLVLIGARPEPVDCASLSIVATEAAYWILLSPPAAGGRGAEHGCALLLPRDERTIEIGPGPAD